jgi:hypothetical protein
MSGMHGDRDPSMAVRFLSTTARERLDNHGMKIR